MNNVLRTREFDDAFMVFMKKCRILVSTDTNYSVSLTVTEGFKYMKIINHSTQRSAWAFVEKATGTILKPACWASPAKHARGNIFDTFGGMNMMEWTGPMYLR